MMTSVDDPAIPGLLGPVPRPRTSRARVRSWNELGVRLWVVVTLAVVAAAIYITTARLSQALDDRWLIQYGVPVNAKVLSGNSSNIPRSWPRSDPIGARLLITLPDQAPMEMDVVLEPRQGAHLQVGGVLPIRVDPANPQRWTEEQTPRPWSAELVVPAMLVPVIGVLAIITLLKRRGVLKVWSDGEVVEAVVVEARQTAMAPASRVIRFSLAENDDPRIFSLLLPTRAGIPQPGQRIWLIAPPNDPKRAVAAGLYVEDRADQ